jgi:PTH1 family peptidyl-tRNA hydrolase
VGAQEGAVAHVILGLGNPGPAYAGTRHNVGQMVVDRLAARLGGRFRPRGPAQLATVDWGGTPLHLAKLVSYMNASGPPLARLLRLLDADPRHLVVVYDEIDLPFGTVRARQRGRSAGHRGMTSILQTLGTEEVRRVRVGIGRPATKEQVPDWVLTPFDPGEQDALPEILERAADAALALAALDAAGGAARVDT